MERHGGHNRQRRLVAVSVLLPLWVWLVAAFPITRWASPSG
ncbi:MAG: hypothetical protein ACLUI3_12955 [Christensenellales bacterium]